MTGDDVARDVNFARGACPQFDQGPFCDIVHRFKVPEDAVHARSLSTLEDSLTNWA